MLIEDRCMHGHLKAVHTVFKEEKSNLFVMDNKYSKTVCS